MNFKTLIVLYGDGKCVAKIANKEAMDYICSVGPSFKQGEICEDIPESVLFGFEESFPIGTGKVQISPLQCANERANAIPGMVFETQQLAMAFARDNNLVLAFEYRGVLS